MGGNAEALATYADSYYAGTPALIRNRVGKGEAYYFGGAFALDTAELFVQKLGIGEPYAEVMEIPAGCELAVREKKGTKYLFVLNYGKDPAGGVLKTGLPVNCFPEKSAMGHRSWSRMASGYIK